MPDTPDQLTLKRHRDLDGRDWHIWVRRGLFAVVCALTVLALFNVLLALWLWWDARTEDAAV